MLIVPAGAVAAPTECDRLAAHPSDPDKIAEGVSSTAVRGWNKAAIAACREDSRSDPENPRLQYQLGRALFYAGERAEALGQLTVAAEAKHRQAQFVLGLMYTDGVGELLAADACRALELWRDAAGRGHFAARVALGRDYVRGRYRSCEAPPEPGQVEAWLRAARSETSDYYQQLLIDWSLESLPGGR